MLQGPWNVQIPSIIDDEYLLEEGAGFQPADIPSRMNLFVYSLQLFDIMEEILSTFYISSSGSHASKEQYSDIRNRKNLGEVLEINARLDQFRDSIPEALKPEVVSVMRNEPRYNHIKLQSMVLYCRFVYSFPNVYISPDAM